LKVLVTGGAGFVAPHVVSDLEDAGHQVVVFDQREPVAGKTWVQGDLTKLDDLVRAAEGVDGICHLAGVGDVYLAFEQPYTAAAANVLGTANVLEAAKRNGVKKVVYASTWEVYGEPVYQPIDEEHPCRPDHPYNITKHAGEELALSYDRLKDVPVIALRLGTAYGRGMRPNAVFSIFVQRAMRGESITIKGTGAQSRQFTHTSDIARAFRIALESPVRREAFNVVALEDISIRQLAEMIAERFPTEIRFEEARAGDIQPARVSAEKARHMLGWEASVPFRAGLADLIGSHCGEESQLQPQRGVLVASP
jgi:UDP-glucose 4-epimerase